MPETPDHLQPGHHPEHEDFRTRHAPMPLELPLDDEEASTDVDLKTQVVRFILTGGFSALFDFGLTLLLQEVFGAPFWLAKAGGFILGTTIAYLINRRWTFRAEPSTARFAAVLVLYLVTFFVNIGLYNWLVHQWGTAFVLVLLAFCVAQGVATVINFVVQRVVIFKIR
ncbi:GtrA family protein [Gordonia sp. (in: high G+C Gram-positive bacteria)]|uniref:GtrA family protein n=1 Tax=Gordonia sp. (in: high G+C Gram-positive bacteria) TaxID=84139 RepID=UPI0016A1D291|nr:GtrA family protein [Gordonia sp. (in: high G+C Gram-positive bacteria)]NLG47287.1 GtrA family protein [Gordonia sp. (in: high G+C Gram-positive bacteria)]